MGDMRGIIAIGVFIFGVLLPFNLDVVKFAIVQVLSSPCRLPEGASASIGGIVSLDLRHVGSGTAFITATPQEWLTTNSKMLAPLRAGPSDLIIYVHGFRTSMGDATCAAKAVAMDLSKRRHSANSPRPDVLVFGWPGQTEARHFSRAQASATHAAKYLAELLRQLRHRKVILIGHSLGAEVVMGAMSRLPQTVEQANTFRAVILIQGAIPIASLRTWSYEISVRYPAAEVHDRLAGREPPPPHIDKGTGSGCYVGAALMARELIVTHSSDDITLSRMYATDEIFLPGLCQGPYLFPVEGKSVRSLSQTVAIGLGLARAQMLSIHRVPVPENPTELAGRFSEHADPDKPIQALRPLDDSQVQLERTEVYNFEIAHPSYHEIDLHRLSGWRPFFDWHSPLNYPTMRADLLERIWRILEQRDQISDSLPTK
ncbi:alpha/beta fold hydrolase [Ensifer adhaerens]|uniref:alpha/beta fold hydrolase n=1 Tax=Ensifer adhaerens TaxID=106592 RepID=UPI001F1F78A1|nr:alpha/beta hydrolase [Ensifer adhaerens]